MVSCDIKVLSVENGRQVVDVSGVLDQDTVADFDGGMRDLVDDSIRLMLLRMEGHEYVSSAGIGSLMDWTQRMRRQNGDLILVGPTDKVFRILDLLGLTAVFNIVDSEEMAPQ